MINQSYSNAGFMKLMGYAGQGGNNTITINKIKDMYPDLDFSHFTGQAWNKNKTKINDGINVGQEKYSLEEVFCINSPVTQKILRGYVTRHNVIKYQCSCCGNTGE